MNCTRARTNLIASCGLAPMPRFGSRSANGSSVSCSSDNGPQPHPQIVRTRASPYPAAALNQPRLSPLQNCWSLIVRCSDGKGGNRIKAVGIADDSEEDKRTGTFGHFGKRSTRRWLARGQDADGGATVRDAAADHRCDLIDRGSVAMSTLRGYFRRAAQSCEPAP
jgi:hypothetical protein